MSKRCGIVHKEHDWVLDTMESRGLAEHVSIHMHYECARCGAEITKVETLASARAEEEETA